MAIYILSHDIQDIKDVMTAIYRMSTMSAPILKLWLQGTLILNLYLRDLVIPVCQSWIHGRGMPPATQNLENL